MIRTDGPGVWLSARDCAAVRRVVLDGLAVAEQRGGGRPPEAEGIVAEIDAQGRRFRDRVASARPGCASTAEAVAATAAVSDLTDQWLSVAQVARLAGCSPSYVRRACAEGRLTARHSVRGAWSVDAVAAAAWLDDRATQRKEA